MQQQLKPGPKTGANVGMWSLQGPYSDANVENFEAATAMALIAFQGDGYTHKNEPNHPFTKAVAKGWDALLKRQSEDGKFFNNVMDQHQLYTQALCTIALCELYGMSRTRQFGALPNGRSITASAFKLPREAGNISRARIAICRSRAGSSWPCERAHGRAWRFESPCWIRMVVFLDTCCARNRESTTPTWARRCEARSDGGGILVPAISGLVARRHVLRGRASSSASATLPAGRPKRAMSTTGTTAAGLPPHGGRTDWRKWNDVMRK